LFIIDFTTKVIEVQFCTPNLGEISFRNAFTEEMLLKLQYCGKLSTNTKTTESSWQQ